MSNEVIINILLSMRSQINAALILLGETGECDHPTEDRVVLTVMGGPESWQCKKCGFIHSQIKEE